MGTSLFTVIQDLYSCSSWLWWLVLTCQELELFYPLCFIHIYNFRLRPSRLFVFFDSLAEKTFVARSIMLCMVDNQRRRGAMIIGFKSCWLEAGSRVLYLHQIESYPHLTEDRASAYIRTSCTLTCTEDCTVTYQPQARAIILNHPLC